MEPIYNCTHIKPPHILPRFPNDTQGTLIFSWDRTWLYLQNESNQKAKICILKAVALLYLHVVFYSGEIYLLCKLQYAR